MTCRYNRWMRIEGTSFTTHTHSFSNDSRNMTTTVVGFLNNTSSKTVYLAGSQNSGGTVSVTGYLYAIKLSDV